MLYYVPLEPLEERYTSQMYAWVERELNRREIHWHTIWPEKARPVVSPPGMFLNFAGRSRWALGQMQVISEMVLRDEISDDDVFFFADVWHPGMPALRYMTQRDGHSPPSIYAIDYAGPFDPNDALAPMGYWAAWTEMAYLMACDAVFVGSEHHKDLITQGVQALAGRGDWKSDFDTSRIRVTGLVWEPSGPSDEQMNHDPYANRPQGPYVIWPHRVCEEKGIMAFVDIAHQCPDVTFVITTSRKGEQKPTETPNNVLWANVTKAGYYALLRDATLMLSTAYQETYGYTVREAEHFGVPVLVPDHACYPEYVPNTNRYTCRSEVIAKVKDHVIGKTLPVHIPRVMPTLGGMLDVMGF